MEENTQLPKEVENEIKTKASFHSGHKPDEDSTPFRNGYYSGCVAGATAYATKLYLLQQKHSLLEDAVRVLTYDNNRLKGEVEGLTSAVEESKRENEKLKASVTGWRPLLEDILRDDDNNISCVSVDLLNKIKTYLYGE